MDASKCSAAKANSYTNHSPPGPVKKSGEKKVSGYDPFSLSINPASHFDNDSKMDINVQSPPCPSNLSISASNFTPESGSDASINPASSLPCKDYAELRKEAAECTMEEAVSSINNVKSLIDAAK